LEEAEEGGTWYERKKGVVDFGSSVPELMGSRFGLGLLLSTSRCPVYVGLFGACCSMCRATLYIPRPGERKGAISRLSLIGIVD